MAQPTDSFKQFNYALRPSKQVERKVMIEVLLRLAKAGYNISEYIYLGFGSVYYVDFVMFHKYLFMEKMICIEWSDVAKRMKFNKPFKFIKLKCGALLNHIPSMRRNQRYLVWLDYDRSLDQEMLQDIDGCLNRMARQSIFIATIDARPKLPNDHSDLEDLPTQEKETRTASAYRDWFGKYTAKRITRETISRAHVAQLFHEIVLERMKDTLTQRGGGLRFLQLFNYVYRDGAPMFTIGGVIGTDEDERGLRGSGVLDHKFVRTNSDHMEISVPPLTIREKHWLDSRLDDNLRSDRLVFELEEDLLNNYRKFYKEYPTYMESLL
jgi:hypothetical protein